MFNCPANLASHKRWHKPRNLEGKKISDEKAEDKCENKVPSLVPQNVAEEKFPCTHCGRIFRRLVNFLVLRLH